MEIDSYPVFGWGQLVPSFLHGVVVALERGCVGFAWGF